MHRLLAEIPFHNSETLGVIYTPLATIAPNMNTLDQNTKCEFALWAAFMFEVCMTHWYLGQVWLLIVSIPDLCTLTYFDPRLKDHIGNLKPLF